MNKILSLLLCVASLLMLNACSTDDDMQLVKDNPTEEADDFTYHTPKVDDFKFCLGADVSWLTQMEAEGIKFYYNNGQQGNCMDILKGKGINAIRLRVWVNPVNGYCGLDDVLIKARRAHNIGMDLMIDFHYSDDWADPSQQTIPAKWQGLDIEELCEAVKTHTTEVLTRLKDEGIEPKWVQVGNETGNGMLWPYGQADINPEGYCKLVNSGYDAVKSICPDAKVIIHLQNGQDASLFKWLFDILKNGNARYDVIGMSLYPGQTDWNTMLESCKENMISCISRYGKDVMLCEVGMGNAYAVECESFLRECIALQEQIADNKFLGVLYWEPQVYNDWNGYRLGAFTSQGRPGQQLNAFQDADTSVPTVKI